MLAISLRVRRFILLFSKRVLVLGFSAKDLMGRKNYHNLFNSH